MDIIRRQVEGMERLYIYSLFSERRTIELLKKQIAIEVVRPEEYNQAILEDYGGYMMSSELDPVNYPLRFYSEDGCRELWISGVQTGGVSEGTSGTVTVLEMMGFIPSSEELTFIQRERPTNRIMSFIKS